MKNINLPVAGGAKKIYNGFSLSSNSLQHNLADLFWGNGDSRRRGRRKSGGVLEKMILESLDASRAVHGVLKEKRGREFDLSDAGPFVDAINNMEAAEGQSREIFDLHKQSVHAHFEILTSLVETLRPEDTAHLEQFQTPPVLEILYEEDPAFMQSMWTFIEAIRNNKALIGREAARRYGGMYGITCVVDFTPSCGSVSNVVSRILKTIDIPRDHKLTILSLKSLGMNTSYALAASFRAALESGSTAAEAEEAEVEMMAFSYREPTAAQKWLMENHNVGGCGPHDSFDVGRYMAQYKERIKPYVLSALKTGAHPANVVAIPAYCVGDVGHHIAPSTYNMFKNDMAFAIYDATMDVMENSVWRGLEQGAIKNVWDILSIATGASACASAYILWLDSFTAPMVIDLLSKRFHNYAAMNPKRGEMDELHNADLIDTLARGEKILDTKPHGDGGYVRGVKVDLEPIVRHDVLMNPQRYTYPACAITQRFAAMMTLADFPCFLTQECVTGVLLTNAISFAPETPISPIRTCKGCAATTVIKRNVPYVTGAGAGAEGYCEFNADI